MEENIIDLTKFPGFIENPTTTEELKKELKELMGDDTFEELRF